MITRTVAAFRGPARCQRESGALQWRISGRDRDSGESLQLLLGGAAALDLPPGLVDAELLEEPGASPPHWWLRAGGGELALPVRTLQVHRGAAAAFARALPPVPVPAGMRAGWWLLTWLLRVPGMIRLLARLRG